MLDQVYGDKSLKKTAIYEIIGKVKDRKIREDQRKFNAKKTKRTEANIQSVATSIKSNRRISLQKLTSIHDLTKGTVLNISHKDLRQFYLLENLLNGSEDRFGRGHDGS